MPTSGKDLKLYVVPHTGRMRWTGHFLLLLWLATCAATDRPKDYVGCFFDGAANKDLVDVTKVGSSNTIESCIQLCKSKRYRFAGLQYSTECTCGNSYDEKWGRADESDCYMPCAGNSQQMCGASLRNSIYRTGYLGCYLDLHDRDLPSITHVGSSNTVESCIQRCSNNGFLFAGVQGTAWCLCGSSYGKHGKVPERECESPCPGNNRQICGGDMRNSIYRTDSITPKVTVAGRAETTTPYYPTHHTYYVGILPSTEVQGGKAIASTIPPDVAVCSQQPNVVTVVLACLCCFEAVVIGGLFIYVCRRRRRRATPTLASVTAEYRPGTTSVKEGGELLWGNQPPSHNSGSTPLAVY